MDKDKNPHELQANEINVNTDIHEFAMFCRRRRERWNNPQTGAEKLIYRMTHGEKTKEEYLELENDVKKFISSDASDDDKRMVGSCAESLCMICNAIREGRL